MSKKALFRGVTALLLLALFPVSAAAQTAFGEIVISVEFSPQGGTAHGYAEYRFQIVNRSPDRAYRVTLSLPRTSYASGRSGTYLRSVSQTVEIGAAQTVTLSLLSPARPDMAGAGVAVAIDGEQQEDPIPLEASNYGMRRSPGAGSMLVLASRRALPFGPVSEDPMLTMMSGRSNVYTFPGRRIPILRAEAPLPTWSANWLSYSRYEGIVLASEDLDDLARAGGTGQGVRTALWQYVETGGSLLVLGPGQVSVPAGWRRFSDRSRDWAVYRGGFGECVVTGDRNYETWSNDRWWRSDRWKMVEGSWRQTGAVWGTTEGLSDLNKEFPVVDDLGVPVRSLFVLMILFSLVIGPGNLWLLTRYKRKLWLLWTVPAISLCACLTVFGYMVLAEGWQGHARIESVTILDQTEPQPRASTLGRNGLYSPITPGDGLRFGLATEVTPLCLDPRDGGSGPRTLAWGGDQHLARGWLTARVPAYFLLRKSEVRRERVTIHKGPDGGLVLLNALGADIRALWYADEKGRLSTTGPVLAGAQAALTPTGEVLPAQAPNYRTAFYAGLSSGLNLTKDIVPEELLARRCYLAELESSPFLETGLPRARLRPSRSLVVGLLPEGE